MTQFSRRRVLAAGAAGAAAGLMPLSEWIAGRANAQGTRTRYDAGSPEGKENLKIYSRAVGKMMDPAQYPEGDPRSWNFQWYTHWTKGTQTNDNTKNAEIRRIYGSGSSPNKALAEAMWNTCQAHAPRNSAEENFLPWHRMYVLYLEDIVRTVAGANEFTLPYWSYDNAGNRSIPIEFRSPSDPDFRYLYRQNRNSGVNSGTPIDRVPDAMPMNNDSLKERFYLPTSRTQRGFNEKLDFNLHGAVHVNVGTSSNMGFVPTAAGDPIFWMHHCEIDRFWASWNAAGRANPPATWNNWGNRSWTFVNGRGERVAAKIEQMIAGTQQLGYQYDSVIPVPSLAASAPQLTGGTVLAAAAMAPQMVAGTHTGGALKLGDGPATVELASNVSLSTFHRSMSALTVEPSLVAAADSAPRRVYLAIDDLTTDEQPGVGYNVYLELPKDASPDIAESHFVGSIHFFHAHPAGARHQGHAVGYVFDVTDLAANLVVKGRLSRTPKVTVIPTGSPVAGAEPAIGGFQLIEE